MRAAAAQGWSVHGFDIIPEAKAWSPPGDHVTIAPAFRANLFPQRYAAVLCREVIEHVDGWRQMLSELHAVTADGGLCQVQTPRPWYEQNPIGYQRGHLQLFTPFVLRYWLEATGFTVVDRMLWSLSQAWLVRRR